MTTEFPQQSHGHGPGIPLQFPAASQGQDIRRRTHLRQHVIELQPGGIAIARQFGPPRGAVMSETGKITEGERIQRHPFIGAVHEHGADGAKVLPRIAPEPRQHFAHGLQRFVEIAGGGILAVEYRRLAEVGAVAVGADHRLAEVHRAVRRRTAATSQVDSQQARRFFQQHGNRTGTLGRLAGAAEVILGHIGTDHDRRHVARLRCQEPQRALHGINAAQAGMLKLGHLAVTAQDRRSPFPEGGIQHAPQDDGPG